MSWKPPLVTPPPMLRSPLVRTALVLGVLALASCSPNPRYVINAPANGTSIACSDPAGVSCNVSVDVQWDGVSVRPQPEATLDGAAFTTPFTSAAHSSTNTIVAGVGAHTFGVSGDLAAKGTVGHYSATSTFTITPPTPVTPPTGGFTLSASPNALVVERGKSATTTITVTRTAPFTGVVTIAASTPATGVTVSAATIATGATSATLTIAAATTAANAKLTVNITGTSGTMTAATPVSVVIGRETGAFQDANPTPYLNSTVPSTINALAGTFHVDISAGAPSLPQPKKATFFRGTTRVGNDIGFTLGPVSNVGGAGFCNNTSSAAITRGVVLSGQLPGFASQNVVMIQDMTVTSPQLIQIPADMNVQQTPGGPFILFQPKVFFSKDCTLALVAGANKLGPSKHTLHVYDLIAGLPIGSDVSFETATFSALVRNTATKQEVEVKVDTGAPSAQTVVIGVP